MQANIVTQIAYEKSWFLKSTFALNRIYQKISLDKSRLEFLLGKSPSFVALYKPESRGESWFWAADFQADGGEITVLFPWKWRNCKCSNIEIRSRGEVSEEQVENVSRGIRRAFWDEYVYSVEYELDRFFPLKTLFRIISSDQKTLPELYVKIMAVISPAEREGEIDAQLSYEKANNYFRKKGWSRTA